MSLATRSTVRAQVRGILRFILILLAHGPGGMACGRTSMGGQPSVRVDGDADAASRYDDASGAPSRDSGTRSSTGGDAGVGPGAGGGGATGLGGRETGGSGAGGGMGGWGGGAAGAAGTGAAGTSSVGGRGGGAAGAAGTSSAGGRGGGAAGTGGVGLGGRGGAVTGGAGGAGTSGKPLWRESQEAFCPKIDGSSFLDIWSDERGAFVLTSDAKTRPAIWSNLGTGWKITFDWSGDTNILYQGGLKGFANGPLVVYGGLPCGIQFVDGGSADCSGASLPVDLSVVSTGRAYAVNYDRVLQYDGNFWTQLGTALPDTGWTSAVWADSSTVVVTANETYGGGLVFRIDSSGDPVLLAGLPSQVDLFAVWGFGASDIWVGSSRGQLVHFDGAGWSEVAAIPYNGSASKGVSGSNGIGKIKLWGMGGSLFAIAGNVFGQWDGTRFKVLDSLAGDAYFAGLWGNSPSEIFLAVYDRQGSPEACGPFRLRWFDGKVVGPL